MKRSGPSAADLNGAGAVDDTDADLALDDPAYDLTGDGKADLWDLALVVRNAGRPVLAPVVPYGSPASATLPKYKMFDGDVIASILSVSEQVGGTIYKADGSTVDSTVAALEDWQALLDDDPATYLRVPGRMDESGSPAYFRGPVFQLNEKRTLDTIRMAPLEGNSGCISKVRLRYTDEAGGSHTADAVCTQQRDRQNRLYCEAVLDSPITTDKLEIWTAAEDGRSYTICQLRLYAYDDLEAKVKDLFADHSHTALKGYVKADTIQALRNRANAVDKKSGEHHLRKDTILADLNYAEKILQDGKPDAPWRWTIRSRLRTRPNLTLPKRSPTISPWAMWPRPTAPSPSMCRI